MNAATYNALFATHRVETVRMFPNPEGVMVSHTYYESATSEADARAIMSKNMVSAPRALSIRIVDLYAGK